MVCTFSSFHFGVGSEPKNSETPRDLVAMLDNSWGPKCLVSVLFLCPETSRQAGKESC